MKSFRTWQVILVFVVCTTLFVLAYSQSPLYSSNQYQYFLHGIARAGVGTLAEDWLANTADPTPAFSFLIEIAATIHAEWLCYVFYALLMGVYLFSLISIVDTKFPIRKSPQVLIVFISLMIVFHSAGLRFLLSNIPGSDWNYLFEGGVAGQRLLGPVFQPSVFGVFLLLSISLYLRKKPIPAGLSAALAALVHPTYLLGSAVLVVVYLIDQLLFERQKQTAIFMGLLTLASVMPILIFTVNNFLGGTPEIAERAREILVNIRIPHHARIAVWFDATVVIKFAILGIALYLARRNHLFLIISLPLGVSILLTLVQYFTGNLALALLFPWRISAWLVPIALAMILAKTANLLCDSLQTSRRLVVTLFSIAVVILSVFVGVSRSWLEAREMAQSPALPIENYVAYYRQPGEVYMVPVKMYEFRLTAGVPTYGDFYSIPYKDKEVIEWYSRFLNAKHFYEKANCDLLDDLAGQGVTHVILPFDFPSSCPSALTPLYSDESYGLYLLDRGQ